MFDLARRYKESGMTAYCHLQESEFAGEHEFGYEGVKHQRFVGTGYFDAVQQVITSGRSCTTALDGSTEKDQFSQPQPVPIRAKTVEAMRREASAD
jgi:isocitrate lyase